MGDFNGHISILIDHKLNSNGKILMDLIIKCSLILLNDDQKYKELYTGRRDNKKKSDIITL